ncbi:hypothetical protein [Psychrobacillus antarcticus]|uniref:hypothetical protein n=1 Tax=Psychrobacillus antarcticus TaxID=2879115 RepID=UPI0024085A0F|nr:hypothetical protein [Psychrobacillus antarcticus]
MKNKNYTAEGLALDLANNIGSLGVLLEDLEHARNVLGRMASEAKDKYVGDCQQYFLWDNNDILQMVDSLMFRLLKEINEEYKRIDESQRLLRELTKVAELDEEKKLITH